MKNKEINIHRYKKRLCKVVLIGLNGYTISTGIRSSDLNGNDIIAVPLDIDEEITVGWISHKDILLSQLANIYINALNEIIDKLMVYIP